MERSIPWGVTANLASRRVHDGIAFDLSFPKTGGGEDIDYCIKRADFSVAHGGKGFIGAPDVAVTHPWWLEGRRSYWRFFGWARGDGALIRKYPMLSYYDFAPNAGELSLVIILLAAGEIVFAFLSGNLWPHSRISLTLAAVMIAANTLHDLYRHLYRDSAETLTLRTTVRGYRWVLAVIDSTLIRIASEVGRTMGVLERGEFAQLGNVLIGSQVTQMTGQRGMNVKIPFSDSL